MVTWYFADRSIPVYSEFMVSYNASLHQEVAEALEKHIRTLKDESLVLLEEHRQSVQEERGWEQSVLIVTDWTKRFRKENHAYVYSLLGFVYESISPSIVLPWREQYPPATRLVICTSNPTVGYGYYSDESKSLYVTSLEKK